MRKIATAATLCLLLLPTLLSAAPRPTRVEQATPTAKQLLISWLHSLFDSVAPTTTKPLPGPTTDGRCSVDPNGNLCTP